MPCLVALIVFSIMGIFSASHRKLAQEAFDCVFRRVTLRPCTTGFDVKVKAKVLGPILPRFPKAAKLVSTHFEMLSWVFMVLVTVSMVWTLHGIYNFWAWGDCNGQYATGGFCVFDPTGASKQVSAVGQECKDVGTASHNLSMADLPVSEFPTLVHANGDEVKASVVMLGCYACDYTRKTYPVIRVIIGKEPVSFTYIHYPTKTETTYLLPYDYCLAKEDTTKYFTYVDKMFASSKEQVDTESYARSLMEQVGFDMGKIDACRTSPATEKAVRTEQSQVLNTGIYGTPTIFINGVPVVGPKPARVYERLIRGSWF